MSKRLIAYDPITFEAFTRSITKHRCPYDYYDDGYIDAVERIEEWLEQNTVDAVEVVHGRWEQVDHDGSWRVDRCSICHRRMHYVDYDQPYAYCPNCGAKMDGDGNG